MNSKIIHFSFLVIGFLLFSSPLISQRLPEGEWLKVDTGGYVLPAFIREEENRIQGDVTLLHPFLEKLRQLKISGGQHQVRVVHIGDSHLQAGYLNGTVMRRFHADFGNAGRGLVVPLKLSNTNEPIDYDIISDISWNAARCLSKRPPYPVGIGGISIVPRDTVFTLGIEIPSAEAVQYRFTQVDVYHLPGAAVLQPLEKGVVREEAPYPFITRFRLEQPISRLFFKGRVQVKDSCVYYGFNLENGQDGVLYHTIGINGAQYIHYQNIDRFPEQVESLHPDLIIFSLGTNEAFRGSFSEDFIRNEMDAVVLRLQQMSPEAVIVLTTPAECQWKIKQGKTRAFEPNPYIEQIAGTIEKYARENGFLYWDLFGMSGGKQSSENWIAGDYLSRDRIHFAVSGYRLQGNMFYNALMKEYNHYIDILQQERVWKEKEMWKKILFPVYGLN